MIGGDPTSFFTDTIFARRLMMGSSPFIRAMHPKTEILPEAKAIARVLAAGWVGQLKIHGHRAQIHISANPKDPIVAYTRQAKRHKKALTKPMIQEISRLFRPEKGWNVIDAEWLKESDKLFVFDFLKHEDQVLRLKSFPERWGLLPRAFISPVVTILPMLKDLPSCMKALEAEGDHIEGLVFKSTTSIGFSDTSIIRCRRKGTQHRL